MTPTEQDKELRESTRKSIALLVAQRRGAVNWDEQDYIAAGNILFVCTKLITADRKRVELEARIDEAVKPWVVRTLKLDNLENNKWLPNEAKWIEQEADRIAELKAQQEEVK